MDQFCFFFSTNTRFFRIYILFFYRFCNETISSEFYYGKSLEQKMETDNFLYGKRNLALKNADEERRSYTSQVYRRKKNYNTAGCCIYQFSFILYVCCRYICGLCVLFLSTLATQINHAIFWLSKNANTVCFLPSTIVFNYSSLILFCFFFVFKFLTIGRFITSVWNYTFSKILLKTTEVSFGLQLRAFCIENLDLLLSILRKRRNHFACKALRLLMISLHTMLRYSVAAFHFLSYKNPCSPR